ncbi:MAG TPA: bifunctional enoyl-CoA hydratase/phosphate acetyltransferase, partial [Zeimonas sp.]
MTIGILRNRTFDEISVGDRESLERTLTAQDIQLYAVLSGDESVLPLDPSIASSSRFHSVLSHGMWAGALFSGLVGTRLPGPGSTYLGQTLRFAAPVRVGDTLKISIEVVARDAATRRVRLQCRAMNQMGETVVDGEAEVVAPDERIEYSRAALPEVRLSAGSGGLQRLLDHVAAFDPIRVAVVHPCDALSLSAALDARDAGLIDPVLVAPPARLQAAAREAGVDLAAVRVEPVPHSHAAAAR